MANGIPRRSRRLSVPQQRAWIDLRWRGNWTTKRVGNTMLATGTVRPTALSTEYRVSLKFEGIVPEVRVVSPALAGRDDGEPIPHMYEQDRLCLFRPHGGDWTPSEPISATIIPWISEWLFFYEIWLATGDWLGGGEHPR